MAAKLKRFPLFAYIILLIECVICVFPFLWTFIAASHNNTEIFQTAKIFVWGNSLRDNYQDLMVFSNIWQNLFNSFFISAMTTLIVLLIDAMAGYAFAKLRFKGKAILFFTCMVTMFIPAQVTQVPLFIQLGKLGMSNSLWAVILPSCASMFGVFLMKQHLENFPDDILESGRIDGASEFRTFVQLVLPTMRPAIASLGIVTFVNQWGSYLWPLIILGTRDKFPVPLVLAMMVAPGQVINYGAILLGASVSVLPVLIIFLLFQKNFIEGLLGGAVKG